LSPGVQDLEDPIQEVTDNLAMQFMELISDVSMDEARMYIIQYNQDLNLAIEAYFNSSI